MSGPDPLTVDVVLLDLVARTRSEVLQRIAEYAAAIAGRTAPEILRALADRERLGSTGVGSGVALPHADIPGLERSVTLFARLARPVEWDAIDDRPVELSVTVLSPLPGARGSSDLLARFARILRNPVARQRLSMSTTRDQVCEVFADKGEPHRLDGRVR